MSQYGEEFFQALEKLVYVEQTRRDKEASRIEELRCEQERLDKELREILEEQEAKLSRLEPDVTMPESSDTAALIESSKYADPDNKSESNVHNEADRTSVENSGLLHPPKKVKNKVREKPIHKKEWVSILDDESVERGVSNLSLDDMDTLSNRELLNIHRKADTVHEDPQHSRDDDMSKVGLDHSIIPPSGRSDKTNAPKKKKLAYVPNTFVPNRTLQLRRSGSLTRLSAQENTIEAQPLLKPVPQDEVKPEKTRTSAGHKPVSKGRPAFR